MNEQERQEFKMMKEQIAELKVALERFNNFSTITLDVEKAFRERLNLDRSLLGANSVKSASSEKRTINEAGSSITEVQGLPARYIEITIGNTTHYIPSYNA